MQPIRTRRKLLELGLGFASVAVFGCALGSTSGQFRLVSPAEAGNSGSGSGSGSSSGSSGSGSGGSGNSGPGGGGSSGPGGGDGGDNSGPGGGGNNAGPGGNGGKPGANWQGKPSSSRGRVVWSNVRDDSVEVRYSDGWSEQVTSRHYRLRDPARRTVIERPPKKLDFERLRSVAR
jgi:hypothetical protein